MTVSYQGSWERHTPAQHKQAEPILRHRDHPRELRLQSTPAILPEYVVALGLLAPRRCQAGARGRIGRGGSVQSSVHLKLFRVFPTIRTAQVWWIRTLAVRGSGCQQSSERLRSLG